MASLANVGDVLVLGKQLLAIEYINIKQGKQTFVLSDGSSIDETTAANAEIIRRGSKSLKALGVIVSDDYVQRKINGNT